jgi:hypothetical protein
LFATSSLVPLPDGPAGIQRLTGTDAPYQAALEELTPLVGRENAENTLSLLQKAATTGNTAYLSRVGELNSALHQTATGELQSPGDRQGRLGQPLPSP